MKKLFLALALTTALCLALAAVASADPGTTQGSEQAATTSQGTGADSGATQIDPSNANISIRVLSPGDDGAVTQSNTVGSSATAGNQAATTQSAGQSAAGAAIQVAQQASTTDQLALARSAAEQAGAQNTSTPVRVLSPGTDGPVTQSNTATSQASSGNTASTGQSATQGAGGSSCGCGGSAIQTAKQSSGTEQASGAASSATQDHPSNTNVSIRVLSPGSNGAVTQSNTAASQASSGNAATTSQGSTQSAGGACGCAPAPVSQPTGGSTPAVASAAPAAAPAGVQQSNTAGSSASSGNSATTGQGAQQNASSGGIQTGSQSAGTDQLSGAVSHTEQVAPSNTAGSVRVLSPGNDGAVSQSNTASSSATSGNSAGTTQSAWQTQGGGSCGCGSTTRPIQVSGQDATTGQASLAASEAKQLGASNVVSPVRVWSGGDGGSVSQSNGVSSSASSGNAATTGQRAGQTADAGCGCGGAPIQVLGQKSGTDQGSAAVSHAVQDFGHERPGTCGCGGGGGGASGNVASPVRVWSPGSDGSTSQANTVSSSATSGNRASTTQGGWQRADGSVIQVLGQEAKTGQLTYAESLAAQLGASNEASPVRVQSPGGGGSVSQSNTAGSTASSGNAAGTGQDARQSGGGSCGCHVPPIQVLGQQADTGQLAKALSAAWQLAPANVASPVSVDSYGDRRKEVPAR